MAVRARPYLATALYALHMVESCGVPTMGVDRYWRCYVSPVFVARTSVEELASILVHEVSHLLRDHHGRGDRFARKHDLAGPAERLRMNIAADADVVVVLTDGHTPWPAARPACRTVVGLFGRQRSWNEADPDYVPDRPPAWARVVRIG